MDYTFSSTRSTGTYSLQVVNLCQKVFFTSTMPPKVNRTLMCLIPECQNATMLKNFIPIGLCNTIYNFVAKIKVTRIKPLLHNIIGPTYASFLSNMRGADNAIVVQEYITHFPNMKGKNANMILKIDLEKAFDRLKWSSIRDSLLFFKFPPNLTNLILSCISYNSISIMVNKSQTEPFHPTRRISQGDLISPYLFIICIERLSRTIDQAVMRKDWLPLSISRNGPKISHIFFADDLTLFDRANKKNYDTILATLEDFNSASSQKANFQKSKVIFSANCK